MVRPVWRAMGVAGAAVAVAVALVQSQAADAQTPAEAPGVAKLAVIDVQRILTDSAAGKEVLAKLKQLQEAKQADLKARQAEVTALRDRLAEGRLTLSEDALAQMEKELEDALIGLRRLQDDADRELQKERDEAFAGIEREVLPIIGEVGEEMGFTLILNKFQSGLLFASDSVDITNTILQRFDRGAAGAPGN